PALAWLDVLEIDDAVRLTVELDLQALLEFGGRHLHRSGPLPFLSLGPQRLLELRPGLGMIRIPLEDAHEDQRRLVHQALLQAHRAEADRHERIVDKEP